MGYLRRLLNSGRDTETTNTLTRPPHWDEPIEINGAATTLRQVEYHARMLTTSYVPAEQGQGLIQVYLLDRLALAEADGHSRG